MKINFNTRSKLIFYTKGIIYKLLIIKECSNGRLPMLLAEIIWIVNAIFKLKLRQPKIFSPGYYETKFGKFHTDLDLTNIFIVSPAFERQDKDKLLSYISKALKNKKNVLFVDIGAHVGIYSIAVGNRFKKYKKLHIIAFEPDSDMFSLNSFKLLKKNIKLNKINNIKTYNLGLGDKNEINKIGVKTIRLDSILEKNFVKKYDEVIIKIDIEGYEEQALEGAKEFIKNSKKIVLLIEDCVNPKIVDYLKPRFKFVTKITPYNSFWFKTDD
jgi:precorrin-6B methylase 2